MDEEIFADISAKLNVLIALSLRQMSGEKEFTGKTRGRRGTGDIARFLRSAGLGTKDIAAILGVPVHSVRTLLTPGRRK